MSESNVGALGESLLQANAELNNALGHITVSIEGQKEAINILDPTLQGAEHPSAIAGRESIRAAGPELEACRDKIMLAKERIAAYLGNIGYKGTTE